MNEIEGLKRLRTPLDFARMTREQKRVAVAEDVLAAMAIGVIEPVIANGYVVQVDTKRRSVVELVARTHTQHCEVCALGGMFLAYAGRQSQVLPIAAEDGAMTCVRNKDFFDDHAPEEYVVPRNVVMESLGSLFSRDELWCIERTFEDDFTAGGKADGKARLTRICKEIIRLKGAPIVSTKEPTRGG